MSSHPSVHREVGGPILTPSYRVLLAIAALGGVMMLWRFAAGLAAVSNLNDGYPWGIWIAFDVITGTALGCGGYAVALLVYILNKGEYHPLVRPAILTSLLGYGLAVLAVTVDLGRFWELWKVPVFFWRWTGSPQLEVALCVAAYVAVLLVEVALRLRGADHEEAVGEPLEVDRNARRRLTVDRRVRVADPRHETEDANGHLVVGERRHVALQELDLFPERLLRDVSERADVKSRELGGQMLDVGQPGRVVRRCGETRCQEK